MSRSWRARALDSLVSAAAADPAPLPRFSFCLLVSLAVVVLRLSASSWVGQTAPFAFFLPAVVMSAGYGGLWPGLVSTVLLAVAGVSLFERPFLSPTLGDHAAAVRTFFFVLNGVLISVLADVLHDARRRVRLLEKEREDAEVARSAERLRQQSMALASLSEVLRISETADVLIAQGLSGLGASAGGVALVESGEESLVIRRSVGYPADRPRVLPLDEGPAEEALRTRRVVAITSMDEFVRRYPGLANLRAQVGTREALLMAPLLLQDRQLGVLFLGFAAPRAFTAEDLALFETLASHGAPALERAQRYEAERAARLEAEASDARHRLLAEASVLLAAEPNPEAALPALARRLVPELADACLVHVIEPDGERRCAAATHAVHEREPALAALCEATLRGPGAVPLARALGADEPARIEDIGGWRRSASPVERELLERLDVTRALSAPLHSRGRFLGRMTLLGCGSGRLPGSQDLRLAVEVADRIALALDGARLLAEAQRLNRVKDEFLAMLSHELRTPLGAVLLWADLLASERLEAGPARAAEMIGRSTRSLSLLIEELLDVSRIVAGKLTIDPHSTLLRSLLEGVVEGARPAALGKGLKLELTVRGEFPVVWADSNRLRQVFENVIVNAVKFTPTGGEICVSLERLDGRARVRVRDTGVGMRPELLPQVFERFRQGDSSSRRVQGGLGLGLTIAQHIVDLHDGRISAWSEGEGRGSTFTIELPLTPPPAALGALLPAGAEQPRPLAGRRVLVVDDHEDTLRGIGVALESAGAEVRCAGSARMALDAIGAFDPHAIVSDLAMPEMDGFDLIRTIRASALAQRSVPAIAVSAYASREDRQRALGAGFQDHIPKPVEIPRLVEALVRLLAASAVADAAPAATAAEPPPA
jgi:signal transduction histidine kinase/ActR/RegA family two-component response regulator